MIAKDVEAFDISESGNRVIYTKISDDNLPLYVDDLTKGGGKRQAGQ